MSEIPYLGLNPFSEKDAPFFFGRDEQKRAIAGRLRVSRLTILFGESGVGKSSILQAGVVPEFQRDAEHNWQEFGIPQLAVVVFRDWHGNNPLQELLDKIRVSVAEVMRIKPTDLKDEPTPAESVKAWTEILGGDQGRWQLFLILDQFEEYFQYHPKESGEGTFADEFPRWVNRSDLRVNFLIAMRQDALAKLHYFQDSILNIFDNQIELKRLDRSAAKDAIVKPIGEYNLRQVVADNLRTSGLTVLSGASGVGKSRIFKDGVPERLPKLYSIRIKFSLLLLEADCLAGTLFLRKSQKVPLVTFSSWRGNPLTNLIGQVEADFKALFPYISAPEPGNSLTETLQGWAERIVGGRQKGRLFIILDQFEEFFEYQPPEMGEGSFVAEFARAVTHHDLPVHFLISICDEARDLLKHFQECIPSIFKNLLQIKQLSENSAIPDLVNPVAQLTQQPSKAINIEPELVEEVLNQLSPLSLIHLIETAPGKINRSSTSQENAEIEAPLLQLVMERLWKDDVKKGSYCLHLKTLNDLSIPEENITGTQKIANDHLSEQMQALSSDKERYAMAIIFKFLVSSEGTKIAYPILDLPEPTGLDQAELISLLDQLDAQRILRTVKVANHSEVRRYEIFHDILALPIVSWRDQYWRNKKLEEEEKKAKQKVRLWTSIGSLIGGGILLSGILVSLGLLQVAQEIKSLEEAKTQIREAEKAFKAFGLPEQSGSQTDELPGQIMGLMKAMLAGQRLSSPFLWLTWNPFLKEQIKDKDEVKKDTINGLKTILNRIQEKNNSILLVSDATSSSFSPDGKLLATGSQDGTVRLWTLQGQKIGNDISDTSVPRNQVLSLSFNPNRKLLATSYADGTVRLWTLQGQKTGKDIRVPGGQILSLSFHPKGKLLATGSTDGTVRLWTLQGQKTGKDISVSGGPIYSLSFNPDGKLLATGSADGTVGLWTLQGQKQNTTPRQDNNIPWSLGFRKDGQLLAAGLQDNSIHIWTINKDEKTFKEKSKIPRLEGAAVTSVSFSPDGKNLNASYANGNVRFWNIQGNENSSLSNNLDELLKSGCKWLHDYLNTGSDASKDSSSTKSQVQELCKDLKK